MLRHALGSAAVETLTHSRTSDSVARSFLSLRSHELRTFKKEHERSRADRLRDTLSRLVVRVVATEVDQNFVAMEGYVEDLGNKVREETRVIFSCSGEERLLSK